MYTLAPVARAGIAVTASARRGGLRDVAALAEDEDLDTTVAGLDDVQALVDFTGTVVASRPNRAWIG